jgi:hypothetical protein
MISVSKFAVFSSYAKNLPPRERQALALAALARKTPVSQLAASVGASRKFVYQQSGKANHALIAAFAGKLSDEEVLFYLPVTKKRIRQIILGLVLICHSSFRGVVEFMRDLLDCDISIGSVHNTLMDAVGKAKTVNATERLERIKVGGHDEIFQARMPVLVGADVISTYCYLLSSENSRDGDTWAIRLMELSDKGLRPDYTVADGGMGLRAGQALAWPDIPCRGDVFHALLDMGRLALYLENRAFGAMSALEKMEAKMTKAKRKGNGNQFSKRLVMAAQAEAAAINLADDINSLAGWLRNDILSLAGGNADTRRQLLDFVIESLRQKEHLRPHRIRPVRVMLENHRDLLLAFAQEIDDRLIVCANELNLDPSDMRRLFNQRVKERASDQDPITDNIPCKQPDEKSVAAEQSVQKIIGSVVRASSIIENINSRLRCYFFLRRQIGNGYLDLLRFFLNHRRFMRSELPERVDKSPAELLSGKTHPHWMELLGFEMFKRAA